VSGKLALTREPTRLKPILASAVEDVRSSAARKRIDLHADIATEAVLDADAVRLTQVFSNLLTNAVKFTPPGGRIDVNVVETDGRVRVVVNDTGPGIPAAALPFVFEPFHQVDRVRDARAGGLGLGLAIAKQVVELHGGRIDAQRGDHGIGCRFVVELAIAEASRRSQMSEVTRCVGS